jgi:hypothetical protein
MLIAVTEGQGWRYEVTAQSDGFLVQARDLDSGRISPRDTTLFRTASVAMAYADMVAAADRYAAAKLENGLNSEIECELLRERERFSAIQDQLADEGIDSDQLSRRRGFVPTGVTRRLH